MTSWLMSFAFNANADLSTVPVNDRLFLDSGAFSMLSRGRKVDIDAYADWLVQWRHRACAYANLDVIHDAEQTWANQKHLEARGLHPMPVFHAGDSPDWLRKYVDAEYRYIGLGGLVSHAARRGRIAPWLVACLRTCSGRADVHVFGVTSIAHVRDLPVYSMDSTTWNRGSRYGSISVFDPAAGVQHDVSVHRDPKHRRDGDLYRHAALIRSYGIEPLDLIGNSEAMNTLGVRSMRRAERWLQRRTPVSSMSASSSHEPGPHVHYAATVKASEEVRRWIEGET